MLRTESWGSVEVTSVDRSAVLSRTTELARQLLAEHPNVEEVALFGSYARGDHTPESDLDLLVVVSETDRPPRDRATPFLDRFVELPMDVNLLVASRSEVLRAKEAPGPGGGVLESAIEEGILLAVRRLR